MVRPVIPVPLLHRQGRPPSYTSTAMQLRSSEAATIARIGREHGATEVRLFGSRAVDAATDDSDVDVLVTLEAGRSLLDLVAIKQDIEDALGLPADVVTQSSLSPLLRERILAESIVLR